METFKFGDLAGGQLVDTADLQDATIIKPSEVTTYFGSSNRLAPTEDAVVYALRRSKSGHGAKIHPWAEGLEVYRSYIIGASRYLIEDPMKLSSPTGVFPQRN